MAGAASNLPTARSPLRRLKSGCSRLRLAPINSCLSLPLPCFARMSPISMTSSGGLRMSVSRKRRGRAWCILERRTESRSVGCARRHPCWRPRHALLAAQPHPHAQTIAQHRWPQHDARADCGAPRVSISRVAASHILAEPVGRNTAAAIGLAAAHLLHSGMGEQNDALMAVLPADHYIAQPARYLKIVRAALHVSHASGSLVVLGIPPS